MHSEKGSDGRFFQRLLKRFSRRRRREIEPDGRWLTGAAIIMIHAQTGEIWVHKDLQDNRLTGRRKDFFSIPFETIKEDESHRENVLGGLVEIFDDIDRSGNPVIPKLAESLFTVDEDLMSAKPVLFSEGANDYTFNVAVLFYDGEPFDIEPLDNKEAGEGQWMDPEWLLGLEAVRPAARAVIEYTMRRYKILQSKRGEYQFFSDRRKRVLTKDFSLREYFQQRELKKDLEPVPVWTM